MTSLCVSVCDLCWSNDYWLLASSPCESEHTRDGAICHSSSYPFIFLLFKYFNSVGVNVLYSPIAYMKPLRFTWLWKQCKQPNTHTPTNTFTHNMHTNRQTLQCLKSPLTKTFRIHYTHLCIYIFLEGEPLKHIDTHMDLKQQHERRRKKRKVYRHEYKATAFSIFTSFVCDDDFCIKAPSNHFTASSSSSGIIQRH